MHDRIKFGSQAGYERPAVTQPKIFHAYMSFISRHWPNIGRSDKSPWPYDVIASYTCVTRREMRN